MVKRQKTRYRSSFETDRKIIITLALKKEFPQYYLGTQIQKDYRTVLRRVHFLEKTGLIAAKAEPSKKGGIKKRMLSLTQAGLLYALANPEEKAIWTEIDKIAEKYKDFLPLVFGEWEFFRANGLRDEIISRLQAAAIGFSNRLGRDWFRIVQTTDFHLKDLKVELKKLEGEEVSKEVMARYRNIAPTLTNKVLGFDTFLFREEWIDKTFLLKLLENLRLKEYLDNEFEYWAVTTKMDYDNAIAGQKWYQELKDGK